MRFTDPARITVKIPGTPEICNVYKYHCVFNPEEKDDIADRCRNAQIGCVACKKRLNEVLNALLDPIRERRAYYDSHRPLVRDLIVEGTRKANEVGNANLHEIKKRCTCSSDFYDTCQKSHHWVPPDDGFCVECAEIDKNLSFEAGQTDGNCQWVVNLLEICA